MKTPYPPEAQLLLACISMQLHQSEPHAESLKPFLSATFDWKYFLHMTSLNRVITLVWNSLSLIESHLPKNVARELRSANNQIALHHAIHLQELKRLSMLLNMHNIPFIPMKGPQLAMSYQRPVLREWSDLDILILRKDIERFDELLPMFGYQQGQQEDNLTLPELLEIHHSYNIVKTDDSVSIDVHWRLSEDEDDLRYPAELVWESAKPDRCFGFEALQLDQHNQLLYTCLHHGLKHGWSELRLIADWMLLLQHLPADTDWKDLLKVAEQRGLRRAFLTGTELARQLLDHSIPIYLGKQIRVDRLARRAVRVISKGIFSPTPIIPKFSFYPPNRILVEDNILKARWKIAKLYLKPNRSDKEFVALPEHLYFLYYLVRPIRLAKKYGWRASI
jgi:hypothetical protein